jgi:glutamine amidotransferase
MSPKVAIIDYGVGNLRSVQKGLALKGAEAVITADREAIEACDAIVLPGVGAFRDAMERLRPLKNLLLRSIEEKPVLGICLGMQLFFDESEEDGLHRGLKVIRGRVIRIPGNVKVPQMGWNRVEIKKKSRLLRGIESGEYFYFVHSYYAVPEEEVTVAATNYGTQIAAVVEKGNALATQFHPEKSGKAGLRILENFVSLAEES